MRTSPTRLAAAVVASGACLVLGPPVAGAAPPQGGIVDASATLVDEELCDFPVEVVFDGSYRLRVSEGGAARVAILPHGPFRETWSANGTSIGIVYTPNLRFVAEDDGVLVMTRLGLFAGVPVRGAGQLWVEAGRIRIDTSTGEVLSTAGLWPTLALTDPSGLAPVCEALS